MSILNAAEKAEAIREVAEGIESFGETGVLKRPSGTAPAHGFRDGDFTQVVASFALHWQATPTERLQNEVPMAWFTCLPDLDIRKRDMVVFGGASYIVENVIPHNLFGAMTHKEVRVSDFMGSVEEDDADPDLG